MVISLSLELLIISNNYWVTRSIIYFILNSFQSFSTFFTSSNASNDPRFWTVSNCSCIFENFVVLLLLFLRLFLQILLSFFINVFLNSIYYCISYLIFKTSKVDALWRHLILYQFFLLNCIFLRVTLSQLLLKWLIEVIFSFSFAFRSWFCFCFRFYFHFSLRFNCSFHLCLGFYLDCHLTGSCTGINNGYLFRSQQC